MVPVLADIRQIRRIAPGDIRGTIKAIWETLLLIDIGIVIPNEEEAARLFMLVEELEEELRKGEKYFMAGSRELGEVSFERVRQGINYTKLMIWGRT